MESPEQRLARVLREEVAISPHDPVWPEAFRREKGHLRSCLPPDLIRRIEHFGSTAVAREYEALKLRLAAAPRHDRVAYTQGKTELIEHVTEQARRYYRGGSPR